jgi:hypothetical protein
VAITLPAQILDMAGQVMRTTATPVPARTR